MNVTIGSGSATAAVQAYGATVFCPGGVVIMAANTGTGLTYQWKRNGANISGATLYWYSANQPGSYTAAVSSGGCTATSNGISVTWCTAGMILDDGTAELEGERVGDGAEEAITTVQEDPVTPHTSN